MSVSDKKRLYEVGVFVSQGKRRLRYTAYTTWFDPSWDGCRMVQVKAASGKEAKSIAIAACRKLDQRARWGAQR